MNANLLDIECKNSFLDTSEEWLAGQDDVLSQVGVRFNYAMCFAEGVGNLPDFLLIRGGPNRNNPVDGVAVEREHETCDANSFSFNTDDIFSVLSDLSRRVEVRELSFDGSEQFDFERALTQLPEPYCWLTESEDPELPCYLSEDHHGFAFYLTGIGLHRVRIALDYLWEDVKVVETGFKEDAGFVKLRMPRQVLDLFNEYEGATLSELCRDYELIPKLITAVGDEIKSVGVGNTDNETVLRRIQRGIFVVPKGEEGSFCLVNDNTAELYFQIENEGVSSYA